MPFIVRTFNVTLPERQPWSAQEMLFGIPEHGFRLDTRAEDFICRYYRDLDEPYFAGPAEHAILTAEELGCEDFPLYWDLRSQQRLYAASKRYLPPGKVFELVAPDALMCLCLEQNLGTIGTKLTALSLTTDDMLLQAVCHPKGPACEQWLYGVDVRTKRFSHSDRFLLGVRSLEPNEQEAYRKVEVPPMILGTRTEKLSELNPVYIPDTRPGNYCAQLAVRSIAEAFGCAKTKDEKYFSHALPMQVTKRLRDQYGISAPWYFWSRQDFERNLTSAIDAGNLVDLCLYAQRRLHGQHNQVVCGYIRYGRELYWMVYDGQFDEHEYDLPRGNVLLSTEELRDHFPKYGLWLFGFGAFANIVLC